MAWAYYNEFDKEKADLLSGLIDRGLIAPGCVDSRSIHDVSADDLAGFTQCHFFAGIGLWSDALRKAGVPDDISVWTGSCPCQPFSSSGRNEGFNDERHLWPEWYRLIRERNPSLVFGEQVSGKNGRDWLDLVSADMERSSYIGGALDVCSAGLGYPVVRNRNYMVWMAQPFSVGQEVAVLDTRGSEAPTGRWETGIARVCGAGDRAEFDWYEAAGKRRPIERGIIPFLDGNRPGMEQMLHGYGDGINPSVAAVFIESVFDEIRERSQFNGL